MRLYRSQVPHLSSQIIKTLRDDGDIDVSDANVDEARKDLIAILEEQLRRDQKLSNEVREHMERSRLTYDKFGKLKAQLADRRGVPQGDDAIRWVIGQILECFMHSRWVDEVYSDDVEMKKKMMKLFRVSLIDEADLHREVRGRLKNVRPGTLDWDIQYAKALNEVRVKRGLSN